MDLKIDFEQGVPLRRQLEQALRAAVRSGRLQSGAALPSSRAFAEQLGISRGVVVDAYAQLTGEGYLSTKPGSGTRVAYRASPWGGPGPRQLNPPARFKYDLRPGLADFHAFPRARWQAELLRALRELPDVRLTYATNLGSPELRNALSDYLARRRGVVVEPERVVVCCGVSHGLSVLWQALRRRGARRIGIEDPGWRWQRYTVERAGLEPVPLPVDHDGLVVAELERSELDAVVLTPAHQYPTGVVTSSERRSALVAWARTHKALIVEDDYDVEYRFDRNPMPALQGSAPDAVAFLGTTSKMLAPALRLAWMVLPSPLLDNVEDELRVTAASPPTLDQVALATFIGDAGLERHLRLMRRHYRAKRDLMLQQLALRLPEARVSGAAAGLHLLVWLPEGCDEHETAVRARRAGVGVHELHRHCMVSAPAPPALLLGYGLSRESEITAGITMLADVIV